jgi:IS30 family transposase
MWDRWQKGDSLQTIAQLFGRNHSSVARIFSVTGGIRPPRRKCGNTALSLSEREEISRGLVAELSIRAIADTLNRSPSTVSREINRNGGRANYRAIEADQAEWDRALPGVARNDLSQLIHTSPRRLEKGANCAPETNACHVLITPSHSKDQ